jgi:hypothetical protein
VIAPSEEILAHNTGSTPCGSATVVQQLGPEAPLAAATAAAGLAAAYIAVRRRALAGT